MFAAIGIDEQGGVQSDVFTFFASTGMDQAISTNHLSRRIAQDRELAVDNFLPYQTGVAQDRELAVDNFLPYQTGVLAIIHADRHNPRIQ